LVSLITLLWLVGIAAVYFWPGAGTGVEELAGRSQPPLRVTAAAAADAVWHLAAAAAILGAAWGIGQTLVTLRWWKAAVSGALRNRLDAFLAAIGIGLGTLSLLALALSPLGLLRPPPLIALVAVGVVLAAVHLSRQAPKLPPAPRGGIEIAALCLVAVSAVFALIGALAPEVEYDALWYHLDFPDRYLASGSLVDSVDQYTSFYPMGTEMLFAYGLSLDGAVAAKLVHFGFGALLLLATYRLGASVISRTTGLLACAILVATPIVLWEATTAYVELGTAFFVVMALTWVLRYTQEPSRSALLLAGIFLGFALATKTLAALAAFPLAAIVLLAPDGASVSRRLLRTGAFGAVAIAPALPWFIRSQIEAGNPVFPSLYGVFGADPDRWTRAADASRRLADDHFGAGDGLGSLLALPWDTAMHAPDFAGSVGIAYLMLLPLVLFARPSRRLVLIGLFCLGYVVLWFSPASSLQMRFLVPALGPLALLAAAGLERAAATARTAGPAVQRAMLVVVVAVLALSLPPFLRMHERAPRPQGWLAHILRETPLAVVTGAETKRDYLVRRVPAYAAITHLNRIAGPRDKALVSTNPYSDFYSRPFLVPEWAYTVGRAGFGSGDASRDQRALRRADIDYVLAQRPLKRRSRLGHAMSNDFERRLQSVYADERARLYRVRPARHASTVPLG
jgi:Dolichyl-phosphate-mannose-protein mannosyltransferase